MVLELRSGFSRALLELNQIQLGDTELQNQLEETRHGCNKRTLHLETLVLTLKVINTHTHDASVHTLEYLTDVNKYAATEQSCPVASGW